MTIIKIIAAAVLMLMAVSLIIKTACDHPEMWTEPKPPRLRCWGGKRR